MFTLDNTHAPSQSIVAISSPIGLKSRLLILLSRSNKTLFLGKLHEIPPKVLFWKYHLDFRMSLTIFPAFEVAIYKNDKLSFL